MVLEQHHWNIQVVIRFRR